MARSDLSRKLQHGGGCSPRLGLAPRLRVRKHVPRPTHCCVFVFVLVAGAAAITHNALSHDARMQRKGQDAQARIALARKGNASRGREGDGSWAGAPQRVIAVVAAGATGDGKVDVVE